MSRHLIARKVHVCKGNKQDSVIELVVSVPTLRSQITQQWTGGMVF